MENLIKLEKIFQVLEIQDYKNSAYEIIKNNNEYFELFFAGGGPRRRILDESEENTRISTETFNYKSHNKQYTFDIDKYEENDKYTYSVTAPNGHTCITVFISKGHNYAYIDNISYDQQCAKNGLSYPGGGTVLLIFILTYLKKNKARLGIERVSLIDNSIKFCRGNSKYNIHLALMYTLMYGETWYGKYGFRPYDNKK